MSHALFERHGVGEGQPVHRSVTSEGVVREARGHLGEAVGVIAPLLDALAAAQGAGLVTRPAWCAPRCEATS